MQINSSHLCKKTKINNSHTEESTETRLDTTLCNEEVTSKYVEAEKMFLTSELPKNSQKYFASEASHTGGGTESIVSGAFNQIKGLPNGCSTK